MRSTARFVRRGRMVELTGWQARMTLLDWLRLEERSVGTKEGCAEGDCGACTVVLARVRDGRVVHEPVNSCILLAGQADGAEVITIEDLAPDGTKLHPVQEAMWKHHGSQCGFCTPGIVMSLAALHAQATRPVSRAQVCDQLAGNLCRCTGYRPIIEAALQACEGPANALARSSSEALARMQDEVDLYIGDDQQFFAAPRSEASLARLLEQHPDALVVAGATDAGLWITKSLLQADKVIWLGRVAGLDRVERTVDTLIIGTTATLARASDGLGALAPDLAEVIRRFGSVQVRASATVGGNIANGSPIGDLAPCLIALDARLELGSAVGARTIALEDYFVAYKKQDRRPGEYIRRVAVPFPKPASAFRAYKISKRMDEDISSVLAAFALTIEDRRIAAVRTGFGGMAGTPVRAKATEAALVGVSLDDTGTWRDALDTLAAEFQPLSDHRASAAYRRLVARNLLEKALRELAGADTSDTRLPARAEVRDAAE